MGSVCELFYSVSLQPYSPWYLSHSFIDLVWITFNSFPFLFSLLSNSSTPYHMKDQLSVTWNFIYFHLSDKTTLAGLDCFRPSRNLLFCQSILNKARLWKNNTLRDRIGGVCGGEIFDKFHGRSSYYKHPHFHIWFKYKYKEFGTRCLFVLAQMRLNTERFFRQDGGPQGNVAYLSVTKTCVTHPGTFYSSCIKISATQICHKWNRPVLWTLDCRLHMLMKEVCLSTCI